MRRCPKAGLKNASEPLVLTGLCQVYLVAVCRNWKCVTWRPSLHAVTCETKGTRRGRGSRKCRSVFCFYLFIFFSLVSPTQQTTRRAVCRFHPATQQHTEKPSLRFAGSVSEQKVSFICLRSFSWVDSPKKQTLLPQCNAAPVWW